MKKAPDAHSHEPQGQWWTSAAQSLDNDNRMILVNGRRDVERFRHNPRFRYCVRIAWPYDADTQGMPRVQDSHLMELANQALTDVFAADPVAVIVGNTTGDGRREWLLYTPSLHIFQRKVNEALAELPKLPLQFDVQEDPQWEQYEDLSRVADTVAQEEEMDRELGIDSDADPGEEDEEQELVDQ